MHVSQLHSKPEQQIHQSWLNYQHVLQLIVDISTTMADLPSWSCGNIIEVGELNRLLI